MTDLIRSGCRNPHKVKVEVIKKQKRATPLEYVIRSLINVIHID